MEDLLPAPLGGGVIIEHPVEGGKVTNQEMPHLLV